MNEESLDDKSAAAQQSHVFRPATLPQTVDGNDDNGKDDYMALALRQLVTAAEADGYSVRYAVEVIDTDGKRKVYSSDTKGRVTVNGTSCPVPNMALSLVDFDQSSQTMEQCTLNNNNNNPSSNQHPTATSKQHGRRLPYKKRLLMELASSSSPSSPFVPDNQKQQQFHDILHSNRQPTRNTAPRRVSIETTTSSSSTIGFAPSCRSHDRSAASMDAAVGFDSSMDTSNKTISSFGTPRVSAKDDTADFNEQTRNNNMCSQHGSPTKRPVPTMPITEVSFHQSSRRASVDAVLSSSSAAPSENVIATNDRTMPCSKRGGSQTHPSTQNKKRRVSIPAAQQPLNTTPAVNSSSTKKLNWEPPPNSEGSVESRVSSLSSAATGSFDSELEPGEIVPTSVGVTNDLLSIPRRRTYSTLVDRAGTTGRRPTDVGELLEHRNAMHRCLRRYLLPSEFGVDLFESAMIRMGNGRGLSNYPIEFARCSVRLCGAALNGSTHADDDNALFLELTTNSKKATETIRRCCREIDKVLFTESKGHRDYLMYRLAALNRKPGTVYEDGSVISVGQKRLDFSSDLWYMTCVDLLCDRKAPMVDDIIEIQKKHPSCKVHLRNTHCKAYPRIQPHVIVASPIQHSIQKVQQCRKDVVDLIASS